MINSVNNTQGNFAGFSGMASGIDTDELIKQMLGNYQSRVDNLNSDKTKLEWQQESYQNVMTKLNSFHDKYLNVLNRDNYILSNAGTKTATFTSVDSAKKYLDINVNADATDGVYVINEISQLAQRASITSFDRVKGAIIGRADLVGTGSFDLSDGYSMDLSLDGLMKTITLEGNYENEVELKNAINEKLEESFGKDRVKAEIIDEKISFIADNSEYKFKHQQIIKT